VGQKPWRGAGDNGARCGFCLDEIDQAVATYNTSGTLGDIQRGLKAAYGTLNQVQNALEQLDEKQAFKNAGIVMQNIKSTSRNVDQITEEILQGKGTLGRLVLGEDLYLQMNAMMTKANGVMNDLNHYGILFHLNKEWQRTRLKKVTQLNALSSPKGFGPTSKMRSMTSTPPCRGSRCWSTKPTTPLRGRDL
jgi:phospholipid/cholesterol/gamma-HCH transport system substrate-binding protein